MKPEELKQRLVELLEEAKCTDSFRSSDGKAVVSVRRGLVLFGEEQLLADHLISNGVTIRERGEWTFACVHNEKKFYKCSNCWHAFPSVNKESCEETCPHCGADMRGVTDTEKGGE